MTATSSSVNCSPGSRTWALILLRRAADPEPVAVRRRHRSAPAARRLRATAVTLLSLERSASSTRSFPASRERRSSLTTSRPPRTPALRLIRGDGGRQRRAALALQARTAAGRGGPRRRLGQGFLAVFAVEGDIHGGIPSKTPSRAAARLRSVPSAGVGRAADLGDARASARGARCHRRAGDRRLPRASARSWAFAGRRRPTVGNHPMLWKEVLAEPGPKIALAGQGPSRCSWLSFFRCC
jgi:hypothetical protein